MTPTLAPNPALTPPLRCSASTGRTSCCGSRRRPSGTRFTSTSSHAGRVAGATETKRHDTVQPGRLDQVRRTDGLWRMGLARPPIALPAHRPVPPHTRLAAACARQPLHPLLPVMSPRASNPRAPAATKKLTRAQSQAGGRLRSLRDLGNYFMHGEMANVPLSQLRRRAVFCSRHRCVFLSS